MPILTLAQRNALKLKLDANDVAGFYRDLEGYGDPYGRLGLAVTANTGWQGELANGFAHSGAQNNGGGFGYGSPEWLDLNKALASGYLDAYNRNSGGTPRWDQVQNIHNNEYNFRGLDADDWIVNKLLNNSSNPAAAWQDYQSNDNPLDLLQDLIGVAKSGGGLVLPPYFMAQALLDPSSLPEQFDFARNLFESIKGLSRQGWKDLADDLGLPPEIVDRANDYGWAWDNPGAMIGELPPWLQDALSPLSSTPGWQPPPTQCPLVLDMDGNGRIDLVSLANGTARFDFWGDGHREKTGWVAPSDGLLALDKNGNGTIDDVTELFGSPHPLGFVMDGGANWETEHGFGKLIVHDLNGDGEINALDPVWADLRIWRDADGDGATDAGEMVSVDAAGLAGIDVANYKLDSYAGAAGFQRVIEGNIISHNSAFTMKNGEAREIVDAWFALDMQNTAYAGDYALDVRTLFLPTLRGYGQIADLHVAASIDNGPGGLLEKLTAFSAGRTATQRFADFAAVRGEIENILFDWAGIDVAAMRANPFYGEHGLYGAMPEYLFIRKFMGQDTPYLGTWLDLSDSMPGLDAGVKAITQVWENILDSFAARLIFQTDGAALFPGVSYNPVADAFSGDFSLSPVGLDALKAAAAVNADKAGFWDFLAEYIDGVKGIEHLSAAETAILSAAVTQSTGGALSWAGVLDTLDGLSVSGNGTVNGTRWDDEIYGGTGNDTLNGGDGDDVLYGGANGSVGTNDVLIGGRGNDIYNDGWGDDIYQYDYGHDVIYYGGIATNFNVLRFGAGIAVSDVSLHIHIPKELSQAPQMIFEVEGRGSISVESPRWDVNKMDIIDELRFSNGASVAVKDMFMTFHGEASDDYIATWNSSGNIAVYGYDGADRVDIHALAGKTAFIDAGAGDDTVYGGASDDTFFFTGGVDRIYGGGGVNTILLPAGYTAADVSFFRYGGESTAQSNPDYTMHLLVNVDGLGSVIVNNMFQGQDTNLVQKLKFADGSSIDLMAQTYATIGTDGDDRFANSHGGVWSSRNDDVYLFGKGHDVIHDAAGTDTIRFGEGVKFADLTIKRPAQGQTYYYDAYDLLISDAFGNSTVVKLHFYQSGSASNTIEKLAFADGSVVNLSSLEIETHGTDGNDSISGAEIGDASPADKIYAYGGDDTINSGIGNDIVYAGGGHDYVDSGEGDNTVYGEGGNDFIRGYTGNDVFSGGAGQDDLDGGIGNERLDGGAGSDMLKGGYGDDVLIYRYAENRAGGDLDIYNGGVGADTLRIDLTAAEYSRPLYDELQGLKTFLSTNYNATTDSGPSFTFRHTGLVVSNVETLEVYVDGVLRTSAPTATSGLPDARDDMFYVLKNQIFSGSLLGNNGYGADFDFNGDALSVTAGTKATARGGSVTIGANGAFTYTPLAGFSGTDSFSYTLSDGKGGSDTGLVTVTVGGANIVKGGAQADYLIGSSGEDLLASGARNDTMAGNEGNDIYVYNIGDGNDTISDNGGVDKIAFGAGIARGNIRLERDGSDLKIHAGDDFVKISGQFHSSNTAYQIESAVFSDGSTLNLTSGLTFTGTAGNDWLSGTATPGTIIGGRGDDTIRGFTGNDTYVYNLGDGDDTLSDDGGADKIVFGAGITLNDVRLLRNGDNLEVYVRENLIKLSGQLYPLSTAGQIEKAVFADGSTLDLLNNLTFTGSTANDWVSGTDTADILIGGRGNDSLSGYAGNDTYIYNFGDGNEIISDNGGIDKIVFGAGIAPGDVRLEKYNYDLFLHIGVNSIKIPGQFHPFTVSDFVESAVFADGTVISLIDNVTFRGTPSADSMVGTAGNDTLYGQAGNDNLSGNEGNDLLYGGLGNDGLYGYTGNDSLFGGAGDDTLDGGDGVDTASYEQSSSAVVASLVTGKAAGEGDDKLSGIENLIGSAYNDVLIGNAAVNVLTGGAGDDVLEGGAGNDTLNGGAGYDTASYAGAAAAVTVNLSTTAAQNTGGAGTDKLSSIENLVGSAFNDTLTGSGNNNVIEGGAGNDILSGGAGTDTVTYASATSAVTVNLALTMAQNTGGAGTDTLSGFERLTGSNFSDTLTGDAAANVLTGNNGDDVLDGGAGNDTLYGGAGYDTARYASAASAVTVSLALTGAQNTLGAGTDTLSSIENLIGSAFNDTLTGNGNDNVIEGGAGNDTLNGGAGTDTVSYAGAGAAVTVNLATTAAQNTGGAGSDTITAFENILGSKYNDTLTGNAGNNVIEGGAGNDIMSGDAGTDTASYQSATAAVTVSLALTAAQNTGGAGTDTLLNFERLIGSKYNDTLTGNAGNNVIEGGAGNDIMDGGAGTDTLSYQSAASGVSVNLALTTAQNTGGAGTDTIRNFESLTGSAYGDVLHGNVGANTLKGGNGDDLLHGAGGADSLYGEAGADTFLFEAATAFGAMDIVCDFSITQRDKIDITDILSLRNPLTDALSGFVRIADNGVDSILSIDADGGGNSFVQIAQLYGVTNIAAGATATEIELQALVTGGSLIV